ncbi:MAG: hypothetical protein OEY44_03980, partial [Candidatus Peregrinibacteria bacterium]|nr:hypothetical protein [Candidatus Peregrinibacteria bacterium]
SAVNEQVADIGTLSVSNFVLKLRLPKEVVLDNGLTTLRIDNDRDLGSSSESGPEAILGLNEDGPEMYSYPQNSCDYSKGRNVDDDDCDGKEDEDSQHDPVVLWKMIDDTGRSFQPLRGCKTYGTPHPSHNDTNSSLCEMDFVNAGNGELSVTLSGLADKGYDNEDPIGVYSTLQDFLGSYSIADSRKLQMELLIVAPMEAIDADGKRVPIPYYEYGLSYNAGGDIIPSTFFSIKSDGYYRDFKQSITTNVVPRETTRLLDLTIIQQ